MAKKKTAVAFTPINPVSQIPDIVEQKVEQIPAYEDSGVKYQGKYKTQQAQNKYELRAQQTRFNIFSVSGLGAGGTSTTTRPRNDLKFFATKIIVQWHTFTTHTATDYVTLSDRRGTNNDLRFALFPNVDDGSLILDFTDCPRMFQGDNFAVTTTFAFPVGAFVVFSLYGWEEQP